MTTPPASPSPSSSLPPSLSPRRSAPHHRPRWQRVLKWTAISLAVLLVVVGGALVADYYYLNGKITKSPIVAPQGGRPSKIATQAENFVLIGSDTRQGASGRGTGGGNVQGARSDTTILMHIAAHGSGATLISIPRDSYVQIPACVIGPHGQTSSPTVGKFNEAFSIGSNAGAKYGPSCTIHTIETLTHVHIDHYAEVDFAGFKRMVDALGGVRMCVAKRLYDPVQVVAGHYQGSNLNLPAGHSVEISGDQALALMRARYSLDGGGDLPRIHRQQLFIGAMIRKATSTGLLADPLKLQSFLNAAVSSLTTDGFGPSTMRTLAEALHRTGASGVHILTVPLANPLPAGVPTADVAWDPVRSAALWAAIREDKPIPGSQPSPSASASTSASPTPSSPPLVVAPSGISVRVLNGSGVLGAAAKAAAALDAEGFHAVVGGDAASATYASTVVQYGPSKVQSSQTVAAAIPGSRREALPSAGTTITVIVGSNYSGVRPVTIGSSSPSGSPSPSSTPSIPSMSAATPGCLS